MRHILITIGQLEAGGAETRLLQLLTAIHARRLPLAITIYLVSGHRGSLDEAFSAAGAEIIYGKPRLRGIAELTRLCRRRHFDILHANWDIGGGLYCLSGWLAGVPVRISHIRSIGDDRPGIARSIRNGLYRMFLNAFSTRIVGVCDAAQEFAGTPDEKWLTIYNGIAPPDAAVRFVASREAGLAILMLGRVRPAKNPLKGIAVLDALRKRHPGLTLQMDVVGRSDEPIAVKAMALADDYGVRDLVTFHGPTTEPYAWLGKSSVLLLPSIREGLPGVVLEALACGTPVVASDLPGVREIAQRVPGVTMLSPTAPDDAWADAVVAAARDGDRDHIAAAFRRGPFMLDAHVDAMLRLWLAEDAATVSRGTEFES